MQTEDKKDWANILEDLQSVRGRILRREVVIEGQKKVFEQQESLFFLGGMRCLLTMKGWKFYPNGIKITDLPKNP